MIGDDRFFLGSDYPHAEGFTEPLATARKLLAKFPTASLDRILGENAARFFRI